MGMYHFRVIHEVVATAYEHILQIIKIGEFPVMGRFPEQRPCRLNGLEFRCVRRQKAQDDILRNDDVRSCVESGLIDDQHDDAFVMRINVVDEFAKGDTHQCSVHGRQEQPEVPPVGGMDESIGVEPFVPCVARSDRALPFECPAASHGGLESEPGFILEPDFDIFLRMESRENGDRGFKDFFSKPSVRREWRLGYARVLAPES